MSDKKAYVITNGSGGSADRMCFSDARLEATAETEDRAVILDIETEINGVWIPVGFSINGVFYFADSMDCPKCDGSGLFVTGWDDEVYENIEDNCPLCYGTGLCTGGQIIDFMNREPKP